MAINLIIYFLTLHVLCISNAYGPEGRIAHGHNTIPHSAPYIVSLQVETSPGKYHHSCGGAIIDKNWIITAGHCLGNDDRVRRHIIKAGKHNITASEPFEQYRKIHWYKIHENYPIEIGVAPNDIALIYVKESLVWTKAVQPISLPKSGENHTGIATLFGWGLLSSQTIDFPDILQTGKIPIISNEECIKHFKLSNDLVDTSNICTVSSDGISACSSDSGGPLVKKQSSKHTELIGVVSWGPPCGRPNGNSVSVYVRVSSFIEWIIKVKKEFSKHNHLKKL